MKSRKTRARLVGGAAIAFLLFGVGGAILIVKARRFAPPEPTVARASSTPGDPFKVALVGDSWVAPKTLPNLIGIAGLEIRVAAHPGATSRDLLADLRGASSTAAAFCREPVGIIVVSAGINDSGQRVGSDFYAYHMLQLTRHLIGCGKQAVVIEIPQYGAERLPSVPMRSWLKRTVFVRAFPNGTPVIDSYRQAFRAALRSDGLTERVRLVNPDPEIPPFETRPDLYSNPSHLNATGLLGFAKAIARGLHEAWSVGGIKPKPA